MINDKTLYKDFLESKRIYNLNVGYWRIKLQNALSETISSKEQLIRNKNAQGQGYYDGNPIFSYYSPRKNKAVRVIQENPNEVEVWDGIRLLEAWIDKITIPIAEEDQEVRELVISIYLTSNSIRKCVSLVTLWFQGDLGDYNIRDELAK